ncbi:MAG: hypothetical protein AAFW81_10080 [Pseudomonadota bacterium]
MTRLPALIGATLLIAACATLSPRGAIEDRFVELGISNERASCLADALDERLDRDDLRDVADFLENFQAAGSAGGVLDALLAIDNPRVATEIARASVSCAFS